MQLHSSLLLKPTVRSLPAPLTWRGVHLYRRPQPWEAAAVVIQHSHQRLAVRPACKLGSDGDRIVEKGSPRHAQGLLKLQ